MNIQILTLFPELFESFTKAGLLSRAVETGDLKVSTVHLRDYAINTHGQVDDSPSGGGSGMVLRVESGVNAIRDLKKKNPTAKVVLMTPRGQKLTQKKVHDLKDCAQKDGLVILCTRYEGVDERIVELEVDEEISLGDFVLMGGEIAAQALVEAMVRLLPGVLNNSESIVHESFESGLLEYSQYTKPREFEGLTVPEVLLNGNHAEIEKYRKNDSVSETLKRRADLFTGPVRPKCPVSVALMHYPVIDKQGDIITSSLTNLDIHDIARSCKTYGIERFYIVHPVRLLRKLAEKIQTHWLEGYGSTYNPNRKEALELIKLVPDFDDVLSDIEIRHKRLPKIVVTSAHKSDQVRSYKDFRGDLLKEDAEHLILFGTGWGMAPELMERAAVRLEPIVGPTEWNHLSVRAAAAITFDRLFGGSDGGVRNF
jgi:tRNA (guanine37-N1)-methyltransferase